MVSPMAGYANVGGNNKPIQKRYCQLKSNLLFTIIFFQERHTSHVVYDKDVQLEVTPRIQRQGATRRFQLFWRQSVKPQNKMHIRRICSFIYNSVSGLQLIFLLFTISVMGDVVFVTSCKFSLVRNSRNLELVSDLLQ